MSRSVVEDRKAESGRRDDNRIVRNAIALETVVTSLKIIIRNTQNEDLAVDTGATNGLDDNRGSSVCNRRGGCCR